MDGFSVVRRPSLRCFLLTMLLCSSRPASAQDFVSAESPLAIENVAIVPMDSERIVEDRTVLIRGGRISAIGKVGELEIPADATRIDGTGGYLLPGVADLHVHLWKESQHLLFVANGVLSVRHLGGGPLHRRWRERAETEIDYLAPMVYSTGPILDGSPPVWPGSLVVETTEVARERVAEIAESGFDSIKVYNRLEAPVYDALVAAARKHDLKVCGHVPDAVGLGAALAARQDSIEHLSGYLMALQSADSPALRRSGRRPSPDHVDHSRLPDLVEQTVAVGTWNCVTLVVLEHVANLDRRIEEWEARPEMRYVSPATRRGWDPSGDFRFRGMGTSEYEDQRQAFEHYRAITGALHEGGARLLLGTDTPNAYVVPGFSIHDELRHLVRAGLSPYEALKAGTAAAAELLGESERFGTVAVGRRADLVLLDANPLEDVSHFRQRRGVLLRGTWYSEADLQRRLEALAKQHQND